MAAKLQRLGTFETDLHYLDRIREGHFNFAFLNLCRKTCTRLTLRRKAQQWSIPEPITNPQTKDKYLIRSLMEEAITSSQLEGAATTRDVAKEMIRTGRAPRDKDEQMIFNNYVTMQRISKLKDKPIVARNCFQHSQKKSVDRKNSAREL